MKKEDINGLNKDLSAIKIKELNNLSADKEYLNLCDICSKYRPNEKWIYPRLNILSPFSLKAMEELTELIKTQIATGTISEDCYNDITMLAIIFSHLSLDADEEYHYTEFDEIVAKAGKLTVADKIKTLNTVFSLEKDITRKEQYLTLTNVLCIIVL